MDFVRILYTVYFYMIIAISSNYSTKQYEPNTNKIPNSDYVFR